MLYHGRSLWSGMNKMLDPGFLPEEIFHTSWGVKCINSFMKKNVIVLSFLKISKNSFVTFLLETECKLKEHNAFTRHLGLLPNVICTLNLRPVSRGFMVAGYTSTLISSRMVCWRGNNESGWWNLEKISTF